VGPVRASSIPCRFAGSADEKKDLAGVGGCRRLVGLLAAILFMVGFVTPVVAQEWLPPAPDVLHLGSLRGPFTAEPPAGESWMASATVSYFNVWHYTWHVGSIHRHLGRLGEPITRDELDFLENWYREEEIHQIDLEGMRGDFVLAHRLPGGTIATLTVPWMRVGGPGGDSIAEWFHDAIGAKDMRRPWFPRGQSLLYVRAEGGRVALFDEIEGSGIGDVSLALSGRPGRALGGEHRWALAVEAPTGEKGTLLGSGGWDAAVQWQGAWRLSRRGARLGLTAGAARLDRKGSWLGLPRRDTYHLAADVRLPVGRRAQFLFTTRWDTSPIADMGELSRNSGFWSVGIRRGLPAGGWLAFSVGENWQGIVPDWTFHLAAGGPLGARR
jgi:hypothetical protein